MNAWRTVCATLAGLMLIGGTGAQERRAVEATAAKAGLGAFRTTRSRHYLGIGDASEQFRALTLRDCEFVAGDYLDYYRPREFPVAMPARRLTVIILADAGLRGGRVEVARQPGLLPGPGLVPGLLPLALRVRGGQTWAGATRKELQQPGGKCK